MKKTKGECLRNNWNSLNDSKGVEGHLRTAFQSNFANGYLTIKDFDFYEKYMWNEKAEQKLTINKKVMLKKKKILTYKIPSIPSQPETFKQIKHKIDNRQFRKIDKLNNGKLKW